MNYVRLSYMNIKSYKIEKIICFAFINALKIENTQLFSHYIEASTKQI